MSDVQISGVSQHVWHWLLIMHYRDTRPLQVCLPSLYSFSSYLSWYFSLVEDVASGRTTVIEWVEQFGVVVAY
ncbi:uncharacterized protein FMAN_15539 [Fusarium mangiferae]|uniref:Uncharacterized protein n=1 Tax=Fusarium mangiferae TaxID=192010 RepID=A0A1L7UPX4_FUSMA|nr:uncharacterized protein FMAN_15539 [Fusarium mangiferae]CVL09386.1 uncharacterized protein FMAN_15539 [Fusarium mangiferae]